MTRGRPLGRRSSREAGGGQGADLRDLGAEGPSERQPGPTPDGQGLVSGWYPRERVYDVVWSDDRTPDAATGKVPPVGNTVDGSTLTYTTAIGDVQLNAVWSDPDFDPTQPAVYYVRVIEIPTPRAQNFTRSGRVVRRYFGNSAWAWSRSDQSGPPAGLATI
jgi:hypothetical protein